MSAVRVLVVEHEADAPAALVGEWLGDAGCALDVWRPYAGDPLPSLTAYDALLVLGGAMGADDDAKVAWLATTKALIREASASGKPTLGICLGHQLAASALGGEVTRNPRGRQFGLTDVGWLSEASADPLVGDLAVAEPGAPAYRGVHYNDDVVTALPPGATLLATAAGGEVQAARHAPTVWGVQWHPEVDRSIVALWTDGDDSIEPSPTLAARLDDIDAARAELESAWRPLADRFAELAARSGTESREA